MRRFARPCSLALSLCIAACGGGAAEPEPEPTQGAEVAPTPPPPPPPAHVRVIHASPDPAAATVGLSIDGAEPSAEPLAYRSATAYVELPPGAHAIAVRGVASVETGEAPELLRFDTPELVSETRTTVIAFGVADGEPPLALIAAEDRPEIAAEGTAALRFFHAVVGLGAVDLCIGGASPRDPVLPVFENVAPGTFGTSADAQYADVLAAGEIALQLRQQHASPCHGRVVGVARVTPAAGANQTLVAVGRATGRPQVDRELVVCTDPPGDAACTTVPLARR